MLPKILKNFHLMVDNIGYAGRVSEIVLPKLSIKTEDFSAGGMIGPASMDLGLERLECEFILLEYVADVIKTFGLVANKHSGGALTKLTFTGSLVDEHSNVVPVKIAMHGQCQSLDMGRWKTGELATLTAKFALRYYTLTLNAEQLIEIDIDSPGAMKVSGRNTIAG